MISRLVLVTLALAITFGGIFGWKHHKGGQMAAAQAGGPPPAVIAATHVGVEEWQPYLQVVGSLAAVAGIEVSNEVEGQVKAIHFDSGASAQQGELLIELDDSTDQAELKGLLAEQTLARLKFERVAKLVKDKSVSKSDYDEARATLDNAEAAVAAKRALIAKKRIRAPFEGRLGIRRIDIGEYLVAGSQIVPLEKLDPIFADFTLPERELSRISRNQEIELGVQAYPGERFQGLITAIDPGVNAGNRSFRIQAVLANPDQRLRPGMFADVRVVLGETDKILTVPDTAISYAPYGDSVFVIVQDEGVNKVSRRQIQTGDARRGRVAVVSGLSEGEQVVSAGHNKLRNGQSVVIDDRPAPAQRAAEKVPAA